MPVFLLLSARNAPEGCPEDIKLEAGPRPLEAKALLRAMKEKRKLESLALYLPCLLFELCAGSYVVCVIIPIGV